MGIFLGRPEAPMPPPPTPSSVYVSSAGNDSGTGEIGDPWLTVSKVNSTTLDPGTTVFFNRGDSWTEDLDNRDNGAAGNRIVFSAYGSGVRPLLRTVRIEGEYKTFEDIDCNAQQLAGTRCLDIRNGGNVLLRRFELQNGTENGLQIMDVTSAHIEDAEIHDFMKGTFTTVAANVEDAHGISLENTQNVTASGTIQIYRCSGDSIQADPGRSESDIIDFTGATCHFWTAALTSNFNAGYSAGDIPGENAIDTKVKAGTRMSFKLGEVLAHGWIGSGGNSVQGASCFNIKEGADFEVDRYTIYDCERAWRVRGGADSPSIEGYNGIIYDCDVAVRAEDNVDDVHLYNTTIGTGVTTVLEEVSGGFGTGMDVRNTAVVGQAVPATFSDVTNVQVAANLFVDEAANDYRHLDTATDIDNDGDTITAVAVDRDGAARSAPYSIGAFQNAVSTSSFAYFDTLAARGDVVHAIPFRSQADIDTYQNQNNPPEDIDYDATENAMRFSWPAHSGNNLDQMRVENSPAISTGNVFVTWEQKWSANWAADGGGGSVNGHSTNKSYQFSSNGSYSGGGGLQVEVRKLIRDGTKDDVDTPSGYAGYIDIRAYFLASENRGPGDSLPNLVQDVLIDVDAWGRYFLFVEYGGNGKISLWYTEEGRAPLHIYDQEPGDSSGDPGAFDGWWFEHNSSQTYSGGASYVWNRNYVVLDGVADLAAAQALVTSGSLE